MRKWFESFGSGQWTPLYGSFGGDDWQVGILAALAPVEYRPTAVGKPAWDLFHGTHGPGFAQGYDGNDLHTTYFRLSSEPVEPIVIERSFDGVQPGYRELAEEFRLYHNLYNEPGAPTYLKFDEGGLEAAAAELLADRVTVRTALLRQYQAARQFDLLLFIDSTVQFDGATPIPERQDWTTDVFNGHLVGGTLYNGRAFTRFLATKVMPPPPLERCGIWPYEVEDNYFPEFIVGTDENGSPVRASCDPARLDNYFGLNPGAPDYLTPVHFRRDVLVRYYDRPDLYKVSDGEIYCASLWSLRIDNDRPGTVTVYLGDLGEYLPQGERDHWRAHNVAGDGRVSETTFRRAILAQFAAPQAADLRFHRLYREIGEVWEKTFGWPLFREPHEGDKHLLGSVRLPLHDTEKEFEELVAILAKLLVDLLNEARLAESLPPGPQDEKGIAKLERWLEAAQWSERATVSGFLRALYSVRSKAAAHGKGASYTKAVERLVGNRRRAAAATYALETAVVVLRALVDFATAESVTKV